jgi:hypothetical protein
VEAVGEGDDVGAGEGVGEGDGVGLAVYICATTPSLAVANPDEGSMVAEIAGAPDTKFVC